MRAITFIRHGQSEFNRHWAATGTDPLIRDAPLSDLGHEQVRAARAAALALEPDVVISSPLTRALQTAVGLFGDGGTVPIRILGRRLDNCEIAPYLNSIQPIAATAERPHRRERSPAITDDRHHTGQGDDRTWTYCPSADLGCHTRFVLLR